MLRYWSQIHVPVYHMGKKHRMSWTDYLKSAYLSLYKWLAAKTKIDRKIQVETLWNPLNVLLTITVTKNLWNIIHGTVIKKSSLFTCRMTTWSACKFNNMRSVSRSRQLCFWRIAQLHDCIHFIIFNYMESCLAKSVRFLEDNMGIFLRLHTYF